MRNSNQSDTHAMWIRGMRTLVLVAVAIPTSACESQGHMAEGPSQSAQGTGTAQTESETFAVMMATMGPDGPINVRQDRISRRAMEAMLSRRMSKMNPSQESYPTTNSTIEESTHELVTNGGCGDETLYLYFGPNFTAGPYGWGMVCLYKDPSLPNDTANLANYWFLSYAGSLWSGSKPGHIVLQSGASFLPIRFPVWTPMATFPPPLANGSPVPVPSSGAYYLAGIGLDGNTAVKSVTLRVDPGSYTFNGFPAGGGVSPNNPFYNASDSGIVNVKSGGLQTANLIPGLEYQINTGYGAPGASATIWSFTSAVGTFIETSQAWGGFAPPFGRQSVCNSGNIVAKVTSCIKYPPSCITSPATCPYN